MHTNRKSLKTHRWAPLSGRFPAPISPGLKPWAMVLSHFVAIHLPVLVAHAGALKNHIEFGQRVRTLTELSWRIVFDLAIT
jgi:hypothetical protein